MLAVVYSNGNQESKRAISLLETLNAQILEYQLNGAFTQRGFEAEFGTEAEYPQINIGNNQTICLGDAAQLIASTSVQASTDSYQQTNIIYSPELVAGTPISLTDDDVQGPFPIGFSFFH